MLNVLIVDDSAFMRNTLSSMISSDPELKVVGTARDGIEAVEKVSSLKPDIVTMDIEMPKMDGIEALKHIMAKTPVPVIMVSSLSTESAKATLHALEIGAVDFIPKNLSDLSINIVKIKEILIEKIKGIGMKKMVRRTLKRRTSPLQVSKVSEYSSKRRISIVAIGSSTGGPKALQNIISKLPGDFPVPILIAQHMPASFTGPFAERLNQLSNIEIREAKDGEPLRKGVALIAPGSGHMGVRRRKGSAETCIAIIKDEKGEYIYRPSVDLLMSSIANTYSAYTLGIILTGLGNDGEKGLGEIKAKGGKIIAESEESCVVYGMPKAVVEAGIADKIVPLDEIAGEIINSV